MKLWTLFIVVALAAVFAYFLVDSLTGYVISESCCFGDDCSQENFCDSAKPAAEYARMPLWSILVFVFSSLLFFAGIYFRSRK